MKNFNFMFIAALIASILTSVGTVVLIYLAIVALLKYIG